ncbi:MAG: hypothetical protein RDV48_21025 [Candidatus Eremiobacteraeota bacterium]|nr:hypothetical protein [Candidatus Eremiobacteraeota bacterium]
MEFGGSSITIPLNGPGSIVFLCDSRQARLEDGILFCLEKVKECIYYQISDVRDLKTHYRPEMWLTDETKVLYILMNTGRIADYFLSPF